MRTHISLARINTSETLTASENVIQSSDRSNDSVHCTNIYNSVSRQLTYEQGRLFVNLQFMLLAATGLEYGKEYITKVNNVHRSSTIFEKKPTGPSQKGPGLMFERPRMRRQMTGMA
jgi:hypothetical protein